MQTKTLIKKEMSRDKIRVGTTEGMNFPSEWTNINWETIPNCMSMKSKTVSKLFYRLFSGRRKIWEQPGYLTFLTSMPGRVTRVGMEVWSKIFGNLSMKNLADKYCILIN